MNKRNLLKLARYLELPAAQRRPRFDMAMYCASAYSYKRTSCGTAGCAVGHGPDAGIPKFSRESWSNYSGRVFGLHPYRRSLRTYVWNFCFSGDWAYSHYNRAADAARRIRYVVEHGDAPSGWTYKNPWPKQLPISED